MFKIPVYQPWLTDKEKEYVVDCLESNWISSKGKYVNQFETRFAAYIGTEHALTVSNGTVALHLALLTLGIGAADEVIVPTLTYIASVNSIVYTGATPVFVDSLADTWQMDPKDISCKITSKTKAIMVVHLYGHPCDMDPIMAIAKANQLFVIEDCAEAFGSRYQEKHVGTFGDIATFSFYGNKTITTGEGGMVVTNDETLYDRAVHFRSQGLAKHRQYWHDIIGYNYRMTNICAAIGLAQLERIDAIIRKKRQIAMWYREVLTGLPVEFHNQAENVFHSYWMCSLLVPHTGWRDSLRQRLEELGIETRPVFYPVHTMPMYSQKFQRHPVAESIGWRGINLPSWPKLEQSQVEFIGDGIRRFFEDVQMDVKVLWAQNTEANSSELLRSDF
jgi:perosamine synthetase